VLDGFTGCARRNPKALLAAVRGLARYSEKEQARKTLFDVLDAPAAQLDTAAPSVSADPDAAPTRAARVLLAQQESAFALAASGSTAVEEKLVDIARKETSGEAPIAAAVAALAAWPPQSPAVLGGVSLTTRSMIGLAADTHDLRTLDTLLGVLKASDPVVRSAALEALGRAGDARVVEIARAAVRDPVAKVRVAAASALARSSAPEAPGAVVALVSDDTTALEGLRLACEVQGEDVTRAAAARAVASGDPAVRSAAVEALGRQTSPAAIAALVALGRDPALRGDAAASLAHSPSAAAMPAIEAMAGAEARMAARAYFVRRFVRGERSRQLDVLLVRLAWSPSPADRAVGVEALVALGQRALEASLGDPDPRVRAAAAMGAAAHLDGRTSASLAARTAVETDPAARATMAIGLAQADAPAVLPTSSLVDRLAAGGSDAPLAALALARRPSVEAGPDAEALLASHDALVRSHAARGLGSSETPEATGRLAAAYEFEADPVVRRALVDALAARPRPLGPWGEAALALAAQLDPDRSARAAAARALQGEAPGRSARLPEVAWVTLVAAEHAVLPAGGTAMLVDSDGFAWPVAFDEDGIALEPGVAPGPFRLRLAPRMPSYSSASP
jgi:HEAT repeat protein